MGTGADAGLRAEPTGGLLKSEEALFVSGGEPPELAFVRARQLLFEGALRRGEVIPDLAQRNGPQLPPVDADVAAVPGVGNRAVRVPVKMDRAASHARPRPAGIMGEEEGDALHRHSQDLARRRCPRQVEDLPVVVIARAKVLPAPQLPEDPAQLPGRGTEREVAQHEDVVAVADPVVPAVDQAPVVLLDGAERAAAVSENTFAPEMAVGGEVSGHGSPPWIAVRRPAGLPAAGSSGSGRGAFRYAEEVRHGRIVARPRPAIKYGFEPWLRLPWPSAAD